MGKLIGLEGLSAKEVDCLFIEKAADIEVILRNGLAATTARDNGALNIYKDENDKIRCESMKHFRSLDKQIFDDISDAKKWATKWIRKIK
jgi:hypothetical protein